MTSRLQHDDHKITIDQLKGIIPTTADQLRVLCTDGQGITFLYFLGDLLGYWC